MGIGNASALIQFIFIITALATAVVGFVTPGGQTRTRGACRASSLLATTSSLPASPLAALGGGGGSRVQRWSYASRSGECILRMSDSDGAAESAAESMDTLITELANCPTGEAFMLRVSKSVKQVAQPTFFLRLAELADSSPDPKHRADLEKLATAVTEALEQLLALAEEKLDESASIVQIIVSSTAEKNGEFLVPLSDDRLAALRQSVRIHRDSLDNNFLATVQSWMEKSQKDKEMEGMVIILQKVLQVYASEEILFRQFATAPSATDGGSTSEVKVQPTTPANLLFKQVLSSDEGKWDAILSGLSSGPGTGLTGGVSKDSLLGAIQVAVETVVLQEENGSMAQRVQAEFLSELCKRIELASPERPPGVP